MPALDLAAMPIPRDLRQAKALDLLAECSRDFVERLRDVLRNPGGPGGVRITVTRPTEILVLKMLPRAVKECIEPVMQGLGVQPVVARESGWWRA